jgi:hypothetical protein
MVRVGIAVIVVPLAILLFNALGQALCEVWHHEAARYLKAGGGIATKKLNAYWASRHMFLFLGTLAGLVVSQASYLLWQKNPDVLADSYKEVTDE